jgi:hypothetical protein
MVGKHVSEPPSSTYTVLVDHTAALASPARSRSAGKDSMRAKKGLAVLLLGIVLAGCTDNTGAIDQEGHNGFDRMTCDDVTTLARDAKHGAITVAEAAVIAQKVRANSEHGGDPMVRQAGNHLVSAYDSMNHARIVAALEEFQQACTW